MSLMKTLSILNLSFVLILKIKIHVISETEVTQELKMIFSSLKLTWHTLKGSNVYLYNYKGSH